MLFNSGIWLKNNFAEFLKCFVSSLSMGKKLIHPKHEWYEFFDLSNRFPDEKKLPDFKQSLLFR